MWQSGVPRMVASSITTTRVFIQSYFWLLWMPSTSFCGLMLAPMALVLMPRYSITVTCIVDSTLDIPDAEPLPGDDRDMPYFLIGDDAFSLRTWLMKLFSARGLPHEERIFNYRLLLTLEENSAATCFQASLVRGLLTTANKRKTSNIMKTSIVSTMSKRTYHNK